MKIITDIDIHIQIEEVIKSQRSKTDASPHILTETEKAISMASSLVNPSIAYRFVNIQKIENKKVFIVPDSNGKPRILNIGPHVTLLKNAEMAMVSVHTIGQKLDVRVKELNNTGKYLKSYLLDCAGLVALNEIGKYGQNIIEKKAKEKNWGVSASFSPGSLDGWDISDQKNLCSILDINKAGITLSDECLLIPFKSVSTLIVTGPSYPSKKVGSICKFCNFKDTCWKKKVCPV